MKRLVREQITEFLAMAYRGDGTYEEWRHAVMRAVLELVPIARTSTWFEYSWHYDTAGISLDSLHSTEVMGDDAALETWLRAREKVPPKLREELFGRSGGGVASQVSGLGDRTKDAPAWGELWRPPVVDSFGIVAAEPRGSGVCVSVGLLEVRAVSSRELRLIKRLAAHFSAAHRLRVTARETHRTASAMDHAEAILAPNGDVLHALGPARMRHDALRDGRARLHEAQDASLDAETSLEIWRGLVAGRWSLVDHYDTDGKRFLLAIKNTPSVDARTLLSPRERRVCALVAMGHRDKEIAYMLGLTMPSVTAALHRARTKLGVASRGALAAMWRRGPPEPT